MQLGVSDQSAGQQAALSQNLKTVADAQNRAAVLRKLSNRLHDGRKLRDGSAAEVIAVGKTAWNDNRVEAGKRRLLMPDHPGRNAYILRQSIPCVVVAVAARK